MDATIEAVARLSETLCSVKKQRLARSAEHPDYSEAAGTRGRGTEAKIPAAVESTEALNAKAGDQARASSSETPKKVRDAE
jgi:hypothetical protein